MTGPDRAAEVLRALARVVDPELDEPVTELGFVTDVSVHPGGVVSISFRLPTYWCAANFAFMMADDMRREVGALPWVARVESHLGEHMYADAINQGVAAGRSFQEIFAGDAQGDLEALRQTFLVKAFQRRQEALLNHLRAEGMSADSLATLDIATLRRMTLTSDGVKLRARYLERRAVVGPATDAALAFVDADGHAIAAAALPDYLRRINRIGVGAEFNGAICRGLLAARFNEEPDAAPREPTLHDFIRDAARNRSMPGRAA